MQPALRHPSLIHYDAIRRRLWIGGQRCHHGSVGALLAGVAASGLIAARAKSGGMLGLVAAGSVLMAHDWHDRQIWFERGWGTQP
jgi:hypothetical protein